MMQDSDKADAGANEFLKYKKLDILKNLAMNDSEVLNEISKFMDTLVCQYRLRYTMASALNIYSDKDIRFIADVATECLWQTEYPKFKNLPIIKDSQLDFIKDYIIHVQ